eukprot:Colp12_sorted_trinity150504_noHs@35995
MGLCSVFPSILVMAQGSPAKPRFSVEVFFIVCGALTFVSWLSFLIIYFSGDMYKRTSIKTTPRKESHWQPHRRYSYMDGSASRESLLHGYSRDAVSDSEIETIPVEFGPSLRPRTNSNWPTDFAMDDPSSAVLFGGIQDTDEPRVYPSQRNSYLAIFLGSMLVFLMPGLNPFLVRGLHNSAEILKYVMVAAMVGSLGGRLVCIAVKGAIPCGVLVAVQLLSSGLVFVFGYPLFITDGWALLAVHAILTGSFGFLCAKLYTSTSASSSDGEEAAYRCRRLAFMEQCGGFVGSLTTFILVQAKVFA